MNFTQEMGIVLNPGTNIITYYGPDFTGQSSWKEADYMNNLFQGQIMEFMVVEEHKGYYIVIIQYMTIIIY